jgi:hypothetical protein
MRSLCVLLALGCGIAVVGGSAAVAAERTVLVELFTASW